MTETKPPTAKVVPLHNGLAHLATMRRWVAWREETRTRVNGTEFTTKIPYDPRSNRLARIPTDPSTYGTRAQAERRWCQLDDGRRGGVGIVLGNLDDDFVMGIDLDGCIDASTNMIAEWACEVLDRFTTYAEVSPSKKGIKLFFLIAPDDAAAIEGLLAKTRVAFVADKHLEMAIDRARFYAVTDERLDEWPDALRTVSVDDVRWFLTEAGPNFKRLDGGATSTKKASTRDADFTHYARVAPRPRVAVAGVAPGRLARTRLATAADVKRAARAAPATSAAKEALMRRSSLSPPKPSRTKRIKEELNARILRAYDDARRENPRIGDAELLATIGERARDGFFALTPQRIFEALRASGELRYQREADKLWRHIKQRSK